MLGLAINAVAGVINFVWATTLVRIGTSHRSPALKADGHHIMSDVVTSAGVFVGLVLAFITGYAILDPLLAIIVGVNILYQAGRSSPIRWVVSWIAPLSRRGRGDPRRHCRQCQRSARRA